MSPWGCSFAAMVTLPRRLKCTERVRGNAATVREVQKLTVELGLELGLELERDVGVGKRRGYPRVVGRGLLRVGLEEMRRLS